MADLDEILNSIERPLHFASKNSFSHLSNIKGIESTVRQIVAKAEHLELIQHKREKLQWITEALEGFDSMPLSDKKESVIRAMGIVGELRKNIEPLNISTSDMPSAFDLLASQKALSAPIQSIKGVGPKLASLLEKKGIRTVEDALYFIPREYQDRREIRKMSRVEIGKVETVTGEVLTVDTVGFK
ncbi:MAG: ATP-dependent DNA helicase RecG, partial [Deltaproteobacteria bacterium]|nr:ATP-dependent DNA helicase RecG [Deltaproteobacteria bacterium]